MLKNKFLYIISILLTIYIIFVVSVIEALNYKAGGVLPRHYEGSGGWRQSSESYDFYIYKLESEARKAMGLSEEESLPNDKNKEISLVAMRSVEKAKKANFFPFFISTFGLSLYLLCPICIMMTSRLLFVKVRYIYVSGGVCIAFSILSFVLVLLRDYFGSIGL